jgi:hypothetical protein
MRMRTATLLLRLPVGRDLRTWRRALDTVWHAWLDTHDPLLWTLLEARGCAASDSVPLERDLSRLALGDERTALAPGLLAETAARFDHPIGERARARLLASSASEAVEVFCAKALESPKAAAFCVAHHLAPLDEVERALFFLRTWQHEQYRALDPDGALLSLGYRGAPAEVRSALRSAMTALGGTDVLRVLAGQRSAPDDFTSLTEQERAYLVRQLTDQGDWDRLWPLILLMPLAEAVEAARGFDGRWFSGEDERRVFEALRAADPQAVAGHVRTLSGGPPSAPAPHIRIRLCDLDERLTAVHDLDFAPDGTQLAFAGVVRAGDRDRGCAGILDLSSRTASRRYEVARPLGRVAHLGSDTLVAADAAESDAGRRPLRIHCLAPDGVRSLLGFTAVQIQALERVGDTGALLVSAWHHDGKSSYATLSVGGFGGSLVDIGILDNLLLPPQATLVDPEGRLIAVLNYKGVVVADRTGAAVNVLASGPERPGRTRLFGAMSDSVLVRAHPAGFLDIWHEPLTSTREPLSSDWALNPWLFHLAWSPALNRFLAIGSHDGPSLWVLDVPETRDAPLPDDLVCDAVGLAGDRVPACVRLSPRGDVLAVTNTTGPAPTIDLYCLSLLDLRQIVAEPMGRLRHQDLAKVAAVLENPAVDDESRQVLGVLRACLEHRFRHDVGLGDTQGRSLAGDHDIELGG